MQQQLTSVGVFKGKYTETMAFAITRMNMGIRCNNHLINLIWLVKYMKVIGGEEMCQTTNRLTVQLIAKNRDDYNTRDPEKQQTKD